MFIHTYFTYGYFLRVVFLRKNMNFEKLHPRIFFMVSSVYITETFNIRRAKCFDNFPWTFWIILVFPYIDVLKKWLSICTYFLSITLSYRQSLSNNNDNNNNGFLFTFSLSESKVYFNKSETVEFGKNVSEFLLQHNWYSTDNSHGLIQGRFPPPLNFFVCVSFKHVPPT